MRIIDIVPGTSVDGPGLRTSIYVAGCAHRCPGCHNPSTWDFEAGREMTLEEVMDEITDNDFNVTLTGGDPLYQAEALLPLARAVKDAGYTLWCYTGFLFEDALRDPAKRALLELTDVVVDGPFVESLRDISLRFRGSSNQRIIDVARSLGGDIVLWNG